MKAASPFVTRERPLRAPDPAPWRSILNDDLAAKAHTAIHAIAKALRHPPEAWIPQSRAEPYRMVRGASLWRGWAGLSVMYNYLGAAGFGDEYDELAATSIERARRIMATHDMPASLYRGFSGIAWAAQHVQPRLFEDPGSNLNRDVDEALLQYVRQSPWHQRYELWEGLVGYGIYALERMPRPEAHDILQEIVTRLEELAEFDAGGAVWHTPAKHLPKDASARRPLGFFSLGLAHGQACVIAFLARTVAAGVQQERAAALCTAAVDWLLRHRLRDKIRGTFPTCIEIGKEPQVGVEAWCHGDPGISLALMLAARALGNLAWESESLRLAHNAVHVLSQLHTSDAGFCHGASGLGHMFNRMYQATGDTGFRDAARHWFREALDFYRPGEGVGGFSAWNLNDEGDSSWLQDPGIVQGSAGVALTLAAACSEEEPIWDRFLLTNIPSSAELRSETKEQA